MKSPPRQIYVSEPAFKKFIEAMYHHFSFVEHMDVHNLIIGLATSYNSLGSCMVNENLIQDIFKIPKYDL